ncbi:nucleotidyltransferase family protein [Azospirillum halopraeferens]|uniref:nucleotidyltransferase family protein n=1 Tax=Azospirillum halopraeferens TaxID=34010 RepID=UPI0003FC59F2|nr:nucleotidyltransferase family protein [Azospirillum halopraeferens]
MTDITALLIPATASILDAIRCIDGGSLQIALVTDGERRLTGTVTDGDVRRAILRGLPLTAPVTEVMNRTPHKALAGTRDTDLLRLMRTHEIHQLPLVDGEGRVLGIHTLDQILQKPQHSNRVVLMAGGLGKRLHPLTENLPKPMIAVGGKPLLETIVENFVEQGFHRFIISLNYRGDMIRDYFGSGQKWGVEIEYVYEEQRMGTAGSLALLPEQPDAPLIVMNGDILTSINFVQLLRFHENSAATATMAVYEHSVQIPYGVVEVDGHRLVRITEKPEYRAFINAGIYVLDPAALDHIPRATFFDMPSLFETLGTVGHATAAFPIREYWLDIGNPRDLARAEVEFDTVFSSVARGGV